MRVPFDHKSLQGLVRDLPARDFLPLGLAIFSLFSILGPVTDLLDGARRPVLSVVRNSLFSGAIALGYAYGSIRPSMRALLQTVAVQIGWIFLIPRYGGQPLPDAAGLQQRNSDGTGLGYIADVSGHGVSSGVVMGMFKSALRMRLLQPGPLSSLLDDNVIRRC
jgi:hypothetical protein